MNHFDEMTSMIYLDGQLAPERAAEIESHAGQCRECNSLLEAMRREAAALRDALVEADETVPARVLAPPSRESFSWAWLASLGLSGAGVWMLWTSVVEPWQQQLEQAGFGSGNVLSMLLFGGVFWEGWTNMVTLMEVAAAITLGVLGISLMRWSRRRSAAMGMILAGLTLSLVLSPPAQAQEPMMKAGVYTMPAGHVHEGDLFLFAQSARIDGTVTGDLVVFAQDLTVTGRVDGDVIGFAKTVRISGEVGGSVRAGANNLTISGTVARGALIFGDSHIEREAQIGWSLRAFGEGVSMHGRVGRDMSLCCGRAIINGPVKGNVRVKGDRLTIGPDAVISGTTKYRGKHDPEIDERAQLASALEREALPERKPKYTQAGFYFGQALRWAAALLLGVVVLWLAPGFFRGTVRAGREPGSALGLILLFGIPILAAVMMITVVGLAVGMTALLLWVILIYAAQIFVGSVLGEWMLGRGATTGALVGRMAIGLLAIRVIVNLPIPHISWILWLIIAAWGLGAVTLAIYRQIRPAPGATIPASV
jgi:anti-sigma factor RsiW/cytoskeletal protein CcmA (bactofilin family)